MSYQFDFEALSSTKMDRLLAGELIIEHVAKPPFKAPEFRVTAIFPSPISKVWGLIDRCGEYSRTMKGVKDSKELSRQSLDDGRTEIRAQITVGMPFPLKNLVAVTEAHHSVDLESECRRQWKLLEGDYEKNEGCWILKPLPTAPPKTVVHYCLHAEPKIRVPARLQKLAQTKALPGLIEQLRTLSK
jgi:hypothetical protein